MQSINIYQPQCEWLKTLRKIYIHLSFVLAQYFIRRRLINLSLVSCLITKLTHFMILHIAYIASYSIKIHTISRLSLIYR
jgi:hypothetical protein